MLSGQKSGTDVPMTTLDRYVAEAGLTRVDFIKMDVEGFERIIKTLLYTSRPTSSCLLEVKPFRRLQEKPLLKLKAIIQSILAARLLAIS